MSKEAVALMKATNLSVNLKWRDLVHPWHLRQKSPESESVLTTHYCPSEESAFYGEI